MSPRTVSELALQTPDPVHVDDTVEHAVEQVIASKLSALPVVDDDERYKGIFGEREFMAALFPGYLNELRSSAFLRRSLDEALEKRETCRQETIGKYMNTEHVDVGTDFADTQIAEIFLHHRVLIVPVVEDHHVMGIITRQAFFRSLAERFLARG